MSIDLPCFNNDQRIYRFGGDTILGQHCPTGFRLISRKFIKLLPVTIKNKIDRPIAEITNAVE
jgi:hypothetical protein